MGAQFDIDQMVLRNFGREKIFVEAGGSHPDDQNNTFLLEQNGWKGLVVEPKHDFNNLYREWRPNTILENYILVSKDYIGETINADINQYMMGGVINIHNREWNPQPHPCTTLDNLLKKHAMNEIHFLSLDVEGYEREIIDGIDFNDTFIHLIVVEIHNINGELTNFDYLSKFGFEKIGERNQHTFFINRESNLNFNF